ncbi:MAG: OmpA family protein [Candidatus Gastranaerophilales bacterium]|nr:OmpA family protein [Candidatus Gastranaerophilales bacterium]
MGAKVRQKKHEEGGNIFWVTMSDLFIGMFMIFATLFFAFCANSGQGNGEAAKVVCETVQQMVQEMKKVDIKAEQKVENTDIKTEEIQQTQEQQADIEIDPFSGMAKISDMELFELNSAVLTPKGKAFLAKFLPVYFDSVMQGDLKQYVAYIVIQGHTDSQLFRGVHSKQQQYMLNMNLSMNRAYNVANYVFVLCKDKPYYNDLTHVLRVEGASFSRPILVDGKEDYKRSRRVELRLVLKPSKMEVLQQFLRANTGSSYEKL